MEPSFNEFSKVVTKYVLGSQERFNELKERMEMCEHATSKAGAAALGYLIAMEEKEKESRNIYDVVLEQVENNREDSCIRTDAIFAAIYKWLDGKLEGEGYPSNDNGMVYGVRSVLHEAFDIYMVSWK
jgi:hypothetical protein